MREPSGDFRTTLTWPLMVGAKLGFSTPVVMSNARRFCRGMRFVPAAAPAGRAFEKDPPAYTVFPTTAWDHTTPLSICTVGSGSSVTVLALRCCTGGGFVP